MVVDTALINVTRFFRRIFWKIVPVSEDTMMDFIRSYLKTGKYPQIASIPETINHLVATRSSIARYGDGEYNLSFGRPISFQKADPKLQDRLLEILRSKDNPRCLIGIMEFRSENLTPYWKRFWYENVKDVASILSPSVRYYNQSISREASLDEIISLKRVWQSRNVIFVTGEGSRFNNQHELFDNIASSRMLTSLNKNAWSEYEVLLQKIVSAANLVQDPLVICSLGPTATVLAFDLAYRGIQALDLGHITNIYDKMKFGTPKPEDLH